MTRATALLMIAGCGRVGFDPRVDTGPGVPSFDPAGCPPDYTIEVASTTSRYRHGGIGPNALDWLAANAACRNDPTTGRAYTHLVVIGADIERIEIEATLGVEDTWIGLSDRVLEGSWRWVTLEDIAGYPEVGSPAWYPFEPNNQNGMEHCVHTKLEGGFNDVECNTLRTFVCECDGYPDVPTQY